MLTNTATPMIYELGKYGRFVMQTLCSPPRRRHRWHVVTQQFYYLITHSALLHIITGLFIGGVLALQGIHSLSQFGSEHDVGQVMTVSVIREIGPIICGLLFAGRNGSALAAEMGTMNMNRQFMTYRLLQIDKNEHTYFPRLIASTVGLPLLTFIFCTFSIIGGYYVAIWQQGIDNGLFWIGIRTSLLWSDIQMCAIKSTVFGLLISSFAMYTGLHAERGSAGISRAATSTVVGASIAILATDYCITALLLRN